MRELTGKMARTLPWPRVHEFRALLVGALTLEASFILLHLARTQAEQTGLVLLSYTLGGAAFAWVLWRLWGAGNSPSSPRALALVIVAAVAFRLTLLPLVPATSPDVHRYLWEGIVQSHGFNPYVVAPDAAELASLARDFRAGRPVYGLGRLLILATVSGPQVIPRFFSCRFWPFLASSEQRRWRNEL